MSVNVTRVGLEPDVIYTSGNVVHDVRDAKGQVLTIVIVVHLIHTVTSRVYVSVTQIGSVKVVRPMWVFVLPCVQPVVDQAKTSVSNAQKTRSKYDVGNVNANTTGAPPTVLSTQVLVRPCVVTFVMGHRLATVFDVRLMRSKLF